MENEEELPLVGGLCVCLRLLCSYVIHLTPVFIGMIWQTLSDGEVIKRFRTFSQARCMATSIL